MKTPDETPYIQHRTPNLHGVRSASPFGCWLLNVRRSAFPSLLVAGFSSLAAETVAPAGTRLVPHNPGVFRPDPVYPANSYDADEQLKIYGDKRAVPTMRPLIELGRELYREGPFKPGLEFLGKKNLVFANLLASGDWRTAAAWNDTGANDFGVVATRLNLDVDLRITATERIHAFFRPLDKNGQFTRVEFGGANNREDFKLDGNPRRSSSRATSARLAPGSPGTIPSSTCRSLSGSSP